MISFECDYTTGAHPEVLKRLVETNMEIQPGYGEDEYTKSAKEKIKEVIACKDAEVFFISGGTQTNQLVISTMLANYEGVISAKTGHISTHEAGAVEYSGHKVLELEATDGKLSAKTVKAYLSEFFADENQEHMVRPGMVYISFPTEYGTLYSKKELTDLYKVCREFEIPLFVDGARLGYGLASYENDIAITEIAGLCDVFYIGGTKVGALCGEALVFTGKNVPKCMVSQIKQHGALMAKGRLIGVQFDTLFTNNLYMEISKNAIDTAEELKKILKTAGMELYLESPTNQQFVIMTNEQIAKIRENVRIRFWEIIDENRVVVRFATSWSTTKEDIDYLRKALCE